MPMYGPIPMRVGPIPRIQRVDLPQKSCERCNEISTVARVIYPPCDVSLPRANIMDK